jgi:hypothetical protein
MIFDLRFGSFASAKDSSRNVRDNNAAWVAGPGRICFYIAFASALLALIIITGLTSTLNDYYLFR